jgi:hypothetical protein
METPITRRCDRQLLRHQRLADLVDEDCGSNTRLRSRRAA